MSISITQIKQLEAKIMQQQAEIEGIKKLLGAPDGAGVAFLAGVPTDVSVNSGDTAWILTSSCFVLMMTIPGLALFYGKPAAPEQLSGSHSLLLSADKDSNSKDC